MKDKVIVWGTGYWYSKYLTLLKYYELKGDFEVIGVTSNERHFSTLDNYRFINKCDLYKESVSYVLVAIEKYSLDVIAEIEQCVGVSCERILPIRIFDIPYFDWKRYLSIKNGGVSIISQCCFGGILYNRLGLMFLSPTINMFFDEVGFIEFSHNIEDYLKAEVKYVEKKYCPTQKIMYPVGKINGVRLYFNHDTDFEQAVAKWEKRKLRVNKSNMAVIGFVQSDDKERLFDSKINVTKKIAFTTVNPTTSSGIKLMCNPESHNGDIMRQVNDVARGNNNQMDLLSFLDNGAHSLRYKNGE